MEQHPSSSESTASSESAPSSGAPTVVPAGSVPPHATPAFEQKDIDKHKFVAALSYLGILVFVPLLLKRDSAFARAHSAQGVTLLAAWMIALFFIWIPILGWVIGVLLFLGHLVAFISCLQGSFWEVPVIGEHRKKLHLD